MKLKKEFVEKISSNGELFGKVVTASGKTPRTIFNWLTNRTYEKFCDAGILLAIKEFTGVKSIEDLVENG